MWCVVFKFLKCENFQKIVFGLSSQPSPVLVHVCCCWDPGRDPGVRARTNVSSSISLCCRLVAARSLSLWVCGRCVDGAGAVQSAQPRREMSADFPLATELSVCVFSLYLCKTTTMAVRHCKFEARSHRPYLDARGGDPPSCLSCRDCEFCVPPAGILSSKLELALGGCIPL